jgi:hypothetical protein
MRDWFERKSYEADADDARRLYLELLDFPGRLAKGDARAPMAQRAAEQTNRQNGAVLARLNTPRDARLILSADI